MYIGRAESAWKKDTNPPIHEKLKCVLKILNSFAPTRYWLGAHSRCPETKEKKLLCINDKLLRSDTIQTISLMQYKSNTYNFTTIRVTNNLKI